MLTFSNNPGNNVGHIERGADGGGRDGKRAKSYAHMSET